MSFQAIAIDGPAGAGKSTIAKLVSGKLGYCYVDTGAMYRSIALVLLRNEMTDGKDEQQMEALLTDSGLTVRYIDGVQHMFLHDEDVSGLIRAEEVGTAASKVAALPAVRRYLVALQRQLAADMDVVMDGRDIGSNVLPQAELKVYLTASVRTRAKRRQKQLMETGAEADLETICEDIRQRDARDMGRALNPLIQAEDAVLVDSSEMTIDEVVDRIVNLALERK
ncbi:MAG: (d)CMP kinase [Lachnospiraceae bacterium]|nr:(d)CMP kinase [Lachnospiraceae bacterium]